MDDSGPTSGIGDWLRRGPSDTGEVAARYDAWAEGYDADLGSWSYRAPDTVAEIVLARGREGGLDVASVLDVGCGTGLVGRALRGRGFAGRLQGLDLSEESLAVARSTGTYDSVARADLQQPLDLDDASVDAVVCVGVMTYLPDADGTWRELARVTRPGGLVVVTMREDLWHERRCDAVVADLERQGVWTPLEVRGPAPYLPEGYGGTEPVACFYLTARVGATG